MTEALLDWVGNVRLEFINVESDNETIDAVSAPLTAINGGQAR